MTRNVLATSALILLTTTSTTCTPHTAPHPAAIGPAARSAEATEAAGAPLFDDLGDHHHAITTSSDAAQRYFDQGLTLVYAFNHVEALSARYAEQPPEDRSHLDRAYADAMRELAARYPDDLDAATLFAEALMDTMPWEYWTEDGEPRPATRELLAALEGVLERDPDHPGANHYYIHAVEAVEPERALDAADRLRGLVPGAGHLVHMPSHVYLRMGLYREATLANQRAAEADESYIAQCREQGFYPALYYPHNVHFLWYTNAIEGRSAPSIEAARTIGEHVDGHDLIEAQRALVTIARHDLTGHLALARGEHDEAIAELRQAVAIEDGLPYMEPPFAYLPMRHGLGAALLAAGRPTEAEAVYREDLSVYPHNGWSLTGLEASLRTQGKDALADEVRHRKERAWIRADSGLASSRL